MNLLFRTKLDPPNVPYRCIRDPHRTKLVAMDCSAGVSGRAIDRMLNGVKIYNQIGESCTGETNAQCAGAISEVAGKRIDYSALHNYFQARLEEAKLKGGPIDPKLLIDDGTYPFASLMAWITYGMSLEKDWPHDVNLLNKQPGWGAMAEGAAHKTSAFYKLDSSGSELLQDIDLAIRANHPGMITIPVDAELVQHCGTEPVGLRVPPFLGLHRLPILGLTTEGLPIAVNSWGQGSGDGGILYLSRELVMVQGKDISILTAERI